MPRSCLFRILFGPSAERDQQREKAVDEARRATDDLAAARRELARAVDDSQRRRANEDALFRRRALG